MHFVVRRENKLAIIPFYAILATSFTVSAVQDSFFESDKDVSIFLEALNVVQERAFFADKQAPREQLLQVILQAFLSRQDQHSQFLNPKEYQRFKDYQKESYVGLGIELEQNHDGDVLCFPYSDSPAQRAGIKKGDRLLKINDEEVRNKSLFAITALATGKPGTQVKLLVSTAENKAREVIARLSSNQVESISTHWQGSIPVIRIAFFSSQTKLDLVASLDRLSHSQSIVLDLRGNSGGDLYAALECADLFIPEGKLLVSAVSKDKQTPYRSSGIKKHFKPNLFIWQDHGTASAAEVFTAALTENSRAVSIGEKSYGKGTKQNIIELSDGSALILTTEYLITPNGVRYDGIGIYPTYSLKNFSLKPSSYLQKVVELLKQPSDIQKITLKEKRKRK